MIINLTEPGQYKVTHEDILIYNVDDLHLLRQIVTNKEYEIISGDYSLDSVNFELRNLIDPNLEVLVSKSELLATIQDHRTLDLKHVYWNNAIEYSGNTLPTSPGIYVILKSNIERNTSLPSTKLLDTDAILKLTDNGSDFILEFTQINGSNIVYSIAQYIKIGITEVTPNDWSNILTGIPSDINQVENKLNGLDQLYIKYESLKQKLQSRSVISLVDFNPQGFIEITINYETNDRSLSGLIITYGESVPNLGNVLHSIKIKDLTNIESLSSDKFKITILNQDPLVVTLRILDSVHYKLYNVYKIDVL